MAEVYAWCEEPEKHTQPDELILLGYIDRFGAQAVFGRALTARELRGMVLAENVKNAYESRKKSDNWGAWQLTHPDEDRLLVKAMEAWQMRV